MTYPVLAFQEVEEVSPEGAPTSSTAQPVAWLPPLCRRTRSHSSSSPSAFPRYSIVRVVKCLSLACLHHVLPITERHWATMPPLPLSHTLAFSRPLSRESGVSVPQFPCESCKYPVAACFTPGGSETTSARLIARQTPTVPLGQVFQPLSPV